MTKQHQAQRMYVNENIKTLMGELSMYLPKEQTSKFNEAVTLDKVIEKEIPLPKNIIDKFMCINTVKNMVDMNMLKISECNKNLILTDSLIAAMGSAKVSEYPNMEKTIARVYKEFITDFRKRYAVYLEEHFKQLGLKNVHVKCDKYNAIIFITQELNLDNLKEIGQVVLDIVDISNSTMSVGQKPHKHIVLNLKYSADLDCKLPTPEDACFTMDGNKVSKTVEDK